MPACFLVLLTHTIHSRSRSKWRNSVSGHGWLQRLTPRSHLGTAVPEVTVPVASEGHRHRAPKSVWMTSAPQGQRRELGGPPPPYSEEETEQRGSTGFLKVLTLKLQPAQRTGTWAAREQSPCAPRRGAAAPQSGLREAWGRSAGPGRMLWEGFQLAPRFAFRAFPTGNEEGSGALLEAPSSVGAQTTVGKQSKEKGVPASHPCTWRGP